MLIDCSEEKDVEEATLFAKLEEILPERLDPDTEEYTKYIDYLVITHHDEDHISHVPDVVDRYNVKKLIDNGYSYSNDSDVYKNYVAVRKIFIDENNYSFARAGSSISDGLEGALVRFISPINDTGNADNKNDDSLVFKVEYKGNSILFTGDSGVDIWSNIMDGYRNVLKSTILQASHHGSRSFFIETEIDADREDFYTDHLKTIAPEFVFISVGDENQYGHPDEDALLTYQDFMPQDETDNPISGLVHCSYFVGTCLARLDESGNWEFHPTKVKTDRSNINISLSLQCTKTKRDSSTETVQKGLITADKKDVLRFKAICDGEWKGNISYDWLVQNNGIKEDARHNEIYTKGKFEKYDDDEWGRDVAFYGRHFMFCRATDKAGNWASEAFVVNVPGKIPKSNYRKNLKHYLKRKH